MVAPQVVHEAGAVAKALRALGAAVGLPARGALVRLLASVRADVPLEVAGLVELSAALVALEGLLAGVREEVILEAGS